LTAFAAIIASRNALAASAILCQALSTLWLVGRSQETDTAVAATVLGGAGLLSSALFGVCVIRKQARLRYANGSLEMEHQSTKRLLEREIQWRMAGRDDSPEEPRSDASDSRIA
jgi:hypothetical protein